MIEDKVVILMLQHAAPLYIRQLFHEVGVVDQLKVTVLRNTHACGRHALSGGLADLTGKRGPKRLAHKQTEKIALKIISHGNLNRCTMQRGRDSSRGWVRSQGGMLADKRGTGGG
jgi:hypothetical protein